jgi:hypothetical protein
MERKVIFRDRQEFQAADVNNVQTFTDQMFQHIITDAITGERQIVGLQVTAKSATEIEIALGRLWEGTTGKIYRLDEAQVLSVFSYLPITDKKYLAISVFGQESDTDIQPRDFLVDLQTGQTEPQAVAMETRRNVVTQITAGLESTDPQRPEPPTGYTVIAYVKLGTSGIESIELADNKQLRSLFTVNSRLTIVEDWKDLVDPRIATLASDVANLARRIGGLAYMDMLKEMAGDLALLKEKSDLPDTYASYGADYFLDADESDTENVNYYARIDEGLRFPFAGQTEQQLALFNPYETAVKQHTGFIIPAYNEIVRLSTSGYAGNLSISQYQYQTQTIKQGTITRFRVRYGPTRWCASVVSMWLSKNYDPITRIFQKDGETFIINENWKTLPWWPKHYWHRWPHFWIDRMDVPYWYVDATTTNISGSQIAQTFLNSQNGWLTKIGLFFEGIDTNGIVYLHLCETENGLPVIERCIGTANVAAESLNAYPAETAFAFPQPVFLEAGKRYALVVTTAGDHNIVVVSGTEYTQGTLFYSMDGQYYQGDYTKDLMMKFYYAQFKNPRTTVELTPISLSDGIADFDILAQAVIPESTELIYEYQKNGVWYPIESDSAEQLTGLPAMVALRAVFVGSQDLMPGLTLTGSRLQANRPATSFTYYSTMQTLGAASTSIDVTVLLENWDAAKHTCQVQILPNGGSLTDEDSHVDVVVGTDSIKRTATFTPDPGITQFQIVINGTTTTALDIFHVANRIYIAQ